MSFQQTPPRSSMNKSKAALTTIDMLRFPAAETAFYSKFTFVAYNRTNPKEKAVDVGSSVEIILPLPFNLQESYAINYSGMDFGWMETAVDIYGKYLGENATIAEMDSGRINAADALQAFARSTFKSNDLQQMFNRVTGSIVNPHMVNVFQNTNLRTHDFKWTLSPTSPAEAKALQNITRQFREKMHPTKKTDYILGFPDEVYVEMMGSEFLYPVFKSVIQDVTIDYTDGRPNSFFTDGSPVTISLSVRLQEVETLTREDFTDGELSTTTGQTTSGVRGPQ